MKILWTLKDAIEFHNFLLPIAISNGFGLGLTGGVIRNGSSQHDVDMIVYPLQAPVGDIEKLKTAFSAIGMYCTHNREKLTAGWRAKGSQDEKWVEVWEFNNKRIDLFFLQ